MIGWIWRVLVGNFHTHKWVILTSVKVFEDNSSSRPYCTRYTLQCSVCGGLKKWKSA